MKKTILIMLNSQQLAVAGLMLETIYKNNGGDVTKHYTSLTGESTLKNVVKQYKGKDVEIIILGDIRGHEWNRRAFEKRMDLVHFIAQEKNLENDPRFAGMIAYSNTNSSPYLAEITNTLFAKAKAEETAPADQTKKIELVIESLNQSNVRGEKVRVFIQKQLVAKNYITKEIKVTPDFLSRKVVLGILQIDLADRKGISMREVLPYAKTEDKKPVDLLLVKTGESVELQYQQQWGESFVEVIKEQFENKGFTVQTSSTEKQPGLVFTGKNTSVEQLYRIVEESVAAAEQIVLSEPVA